MKNKLLKAVVCILVLVMCCTVFASCGAKNAIDEDTVPSRDSKKWFTEAELNSKGLSGLTAPTGLTGDIYTDGAWFNEGYSFRQPCPSVDVFEANAQMYLDYFKTHYDGLFGTISLDRITIGENENWYGIIQKENLSDYFSDNPSKLYKFYYVTDDTVENGYYKTTAVWSLEIRYEYDTNSDGYYFKLYVENAGTSRSGVYTNYYIMR